MSARIIAKNRQDGRKMDITFSPPKKRIAPKGWCMKCRRQNQYLFFCGCKQIGIILYCEICYNEVHKIGPVEYAMKQPPIEKSEATPWTYKDRDALIMAKSMMGPTRKPI